MWWSRFIIRRCMLLVLTLLLVSLLIFTITQIIPGDVAQMILGREATPASLLEMRLRLGLDRPAHTRYLEWILSALRGDLGTSLFYGKPIGPLLFERFQNSLVLAAMALGFGIPLSILLGVVAGLKPGGLLDGVISVVTLAAMSMPEFVSGVFLMMIFGVGLGWFPTSSMINIDSNLLNSVRSLVLPVATLILVMLAYISRMTRSSLVDVLQSAYIRTAFLKGLPRNTIIFKHALRNALLPTITVAEGFVSWMVGGIVVVETLFGFPGLGRLLILSIQQRDVPLIMGTAITAAFIRVIVSLLSDLAYAALNPRIRY